MQLGSERCMRAVLHSLKLLLMFTVLPALAPGQPAPILKPDAGIDLPNVAGRMDHLGADIAGSRLFATGFDNHTVEVIDLQAGHRTVTLSDLDKPQGAFYSRSTNRLFISSSGDGTVKIYDGRTLHMLTTVKLSSDADNLRYDTHSNSVVVGYGGEKFLNGTSVRGHGDGALVFLDPDGKQTGEIALDAHPESFQLEKSGTRVFVNVPDRKEVEVADLVKRSVIARWPITSCTDNFPMALDEAHHRLFVGCRTPSRMLVFDTESGKIVSSFSIAGHTDDLFYDASKERIYIMGEGVIEVWQQKDPDHYQNIAYITTPLSAHTGLFVSDWGRLFEAIPRQSGKDAEILVFQTR